MPNWSKDKLVRLHPLLMNTITWNTEDKFLRAWVAKLIQAPRYEPTEKFKNLDEVVAWLEKNVEVRTVPPPAAPAPARAPVRQAPRLAITHTFEYEGWTSGSCSYTERDLYSSEFELTAAEIADLLTESGDVDLDALRDAIHNAQCNGDPIESIDTDYDNYNADGRGYERVSRDVFDAIKSEIEEYVADNPEEFGLDNEDEEETL